MHAAPAPASRLLAPRAALPPPRPVVRHGVVKDAHRWGTWPWPRCLSMERTAPPPVSRHRRRFWSVIGGLCSAERLPQNIETERSQTLGCPPSPTHATLCPIVRGVTKKGTHMTQLHEVTAGARTAGRALTTLPGPRGWPLVGNLFQLTVTQLPTILEQWADTYGPVYTFRLGRKPVVVLAAPDLIQAVLRQRPETFRRMGVIARVLEDIGGHGLFAAEGTA